MQADVQLKHRAMTRCSTCNLLEVHAIIETRSNNAGEKEFSGTEVSCLMCGSTQSRPRHSACATCADVKLMVSHRRLLASSQLGAESSRVLIGQFYLCLLTCVEAG